MEHIDIRHACLVSTVCAAVVHGFEMSDTFVSSGAQVQLLLMLSQCAGQTILFFEGTGAPIQAIDNFGVCV